MCFFQKNFNKKDEKEAEKFFLDFLEGRTSTLDFWEQFKNKSVYQTILKHDRKRWEKTYMLGNVRMIRYGKGPYDKIFDINPDTVLESCNIKRLYDVYRLYSMINRYFFKRGINIVCGNKEVKQYLLLQKMVPSYISIKDGEYLQEIYDSTNNDYSQSNRIREAKAMIEKLYIFDKVPPKWLQTPEWPKDYDGPLVFSYQKKEEGKMQYFFYNKKTKKTTIIEQFE